MPAKRQALGRGLDALFSSSGERTSREGGVRSVPVGQIMANPHQPRSSFDEEKLADLAASIKVHGLIQPLIVTETVEGYVLIAGERRWRAAQLAGLGQVPVIVKETTPQSMLELALIENIQRADLNALEEANAYRQLIDEFGLRQEDVAERVGKARSTIANLVRLLTLPESVQAAVVDGRLGGAHARALLPLPTPEMQVAAMNQVIKLGLSVRQTELLVTNLMAEKRPPPKQRSQLSPELAELQGRFESALGTRVNIEKSAKGGRVVIHFYSDEDLDALFDAIVGE
ncbi:MAG: ParB/RepB/Spo0J family partition protein [Candidatus Promineofilum sp.]|nr:ParB/RepB/Spo0J family partition protein [Promineifilum sp.]MBP9656813.1 ParB/RepB/Spo0J family partition protein [Promineifilum sp.]